MFIYIYQICIAVFLLQGVSLPLLLIFSGALWRRQSNRLERLRKELETSQAKGSGTGATPDSILESLPKLKPLNCERCGGSVLLGESATLCPYCGTRGGLPEDYAAAVGLKAEVKGLLKSAIRRWRVARVLTLRPSSWLFFLLIFAEPFVLFPVVLIGSNIFNDTWADRAFERLGETGGFLVMLPAFLGFVVWMIVFIFLASLSKGLRSKVPVVPVFEKQVHATETASCQACGGAVEYDASDFACICAYCNVENFRVQFARRERGKALKQRTQTNSVLFAAMEIIDEFVGTFFFVLLFLSVASSLLVIFYAVKRLL